MSGLGRLSGRAVVGKNWKRREVAIRSGLFDMKGLDLGLKYEGKEKEVERLGRHIHQAHFQVQST